MLRRVELSTQRSPWISVVSMGASGSGKTRWLSSFPRPVILMESSEKSWETLQQLGPECWYEPDYPPVVFAIDDMADVVKALDEIEAMLARDSTSVLTIGFDTLSSYCDLALKNIREQGADVRAQYGELFNNLRWLALAIGSFQRNVVWTMHTKTDEFGNVVGVTIPGQNAVKFLSRVGYQLLHKVDVDEDGKREFNIYTSPLSSTFTFRCRDGGKLPSKLEEPTYQCLAKHLGLGDPIAVAGGAANDDSRREEVGKRKVANRGR